MDAQKRYEHWKSCVKEDTIRKELLTMTTEDVGDSFYCELAFGTGGLRGILGAGTNRMNIYTVGKATQGIANYISHNNIYHASVVVGYDSRLKSEDFSRLTAGVFAKNNIKVYIFKELLPTPCLSYAVRVLKCDFGVMITASHNPCNYNGYKVYGRDGSQITNEMADNLSAEINRVDCFDDVKAMTFSLGIKSGKISYVDEEIYEDYVAYISSLAFFSKEKRKDLHILYSPLNGTGRKPVLQVLSEHNYKNVTVVKEQEMPNGNFPTCPMPNPENIKTMSFGMRRAKEVGADVFVATDPDCDRIGVAVKISDGTYRMLSGNEVGILLLDYVCMQRQKRDSLPKDALAVKTIVTTELGKRIASNYGVVVKEVLTGFKYIGEQVSKLEDLGEENKFVFGFEESCGYLSGNQVRDKDGVNAVLLFCDMAYYYSLEGISVIDKLEELYSKYGYVLNLTESVECPGESGTMQIERIMKALRSGVKSIAGIRILKTIDYAKGIEGLPRSNVIKYHLEDGSSIVVRPSGTEPKLKIYYEANGRTAGEAKGKLSEMKVAMNENFLDI